MHYVREREIDKATTWVLLRAIVELTNKAISWRAVENIRDRAERSLVIVKVFVHPRFERNIRQDFYSHISTLTTGSLSYGVFFLSLDPHYLAIRFGVGESMKYVYCVTSFVDNLYRNARGIVRSDMNSALNNENKACLKECVDDLTPNVNCTRSM